MTEELLQQKANENSPSKETANSGKNKINKRWLVLLVMLVLLFAVGAVIFLVFFGTEYKTVEPKKTATPSATTKIQEQKCGGQVYENERQGYRVCFGSNWVKREFDPSAITVGFDPNNIPEASEYFGLIAVSISSSDIDDAVSEVGELLESTSTSTIEVGGISAQQVSGIIPANNLINSGGPTVRTFFTRLNRLYVVTLTSDTTENRQFYDDFLDNWQFIEGVPDPPWSDSGNILVDTPWPKDMIGNPVTISGQALVFEGVVNIRIKTSPSDPLADAEILAESTAQASSGIELSFFNKSVYYTATTEENGVIEVFSISAADGSEQDMVSIPIRFE